ncbi:acyltransferase family protein, partial [Pseudoalteromonas sp.]|uniref:acyltransferase family protein n=1 Tax=Pseudoalteromonas sp. TaxID=53249 RepID=UPI003D2699D0
NILLANRFGDFIGKISYSLYLLHMPIIAKVNQLDVSIELKLLLSLLLSVIAAAISYQFFEKPVANLIRRKVSNRPNSATSPA